MPREFFTFREYMKNDHTLLTAAMEDYLEMIYRLSRQQGFTRINDLAAALNVQPPSATRMVQKLADVGVVNYEKYGLIVLSPKGEEMGRVLLKRHQIIEDFLNLLGISGDVLEETEKIEHTISARTLEGLADFVAFMKSRPEFVQEFHRYRQARGEA
ncbi:MAG: metal-dependent transcriptional regulator [Desulfurispora sp.]|uniref:metal-dependent transcriptional regulator n=1 Tax=Desulfurispora sp. TaxID=3014275 RepID=UPI00404A758B